MILYKLNEIRSPNDTRLDFIIEFGKMALNMAGSHNREKIIIQNIATAIHHTCNGIVSLSTPFSNKS